MLLRGKWETASALISDTAEEESLSDKKLDSCTREQIAGFFAEVLSVCT